MSDIYSGNWVAPSQLIGAEANKNLKRLQSYWTWLVKHSLLFAVSCSADLNLPSDVCTMHAQWIFLGINRVWLLEFVVFNDLLVSKLEPTNKIIPAGLRSAQDKPICHPSFGPRRVHLCLHDPRWEQQADELTSENEMKVITPWRIHCKNYLACLAAAV